MSSLCPFCPFQAAEGKGGVIRTDSVRRHIQLLHAKPDYAYVDKMGYAMKRIGTSMIIKHRTFNGRIQYGYGFCMDCHSFIRLEGHHTTRKETVCEQHVCRPKQTRTARVPRDPSKPPKQPRAINVHRLLKSLEADDYVELDEDCDVDIEKTLRKMVKALKSDKPIAEPVLERLKKEKRMAGLKPSIDERIAAAQEANEALADEDEEPEEVDEFIDVLLPICVEAANASTVRAKQHQTIQDLRIRVEQLEEELDNMKELLPQKASNVDPRFPVDDGDVIMHVDEGPVVEIQKINIVPARAASFPQPPPAAPSFDLTYGGY